MLKCGEKIARPVYGKRVVCWTLAYAGERHSVFHEKTVFLTSSFLLINSTPHQTTLALWQFYVF